MDRRLQVQICLLGNRALTFTLRVELVLVKSKAENINMRAYFGSSIRQAKKCWFTTELKAVVVGPERVRLPPHQAHRFEPTTTRSVAAATLIAALL